jgi:hypothetical protein
MTCEDAMRAFQVPRLLVVALFFTSTAFSQDRPGAPSVTRDRPAAPAIGTATLKGRILTPDGTPLRRAQVSISAAELQMRRTVTTGKDGRWDATRLPAGRYIVTASKPGYVTLQYGQRRPFESGTPIALADGISLEQINMALPRGGVITGRVLDDNGDPVAQAQVQAQRYQYSPEGQRRLATSNIGSTDDLGQFRIYGLNPGDYAVSAGVRTNLPANDAPDPSATAASESLATTYYPGTTNPNEAQLVPLGVGQETSVQIQLLTTRVGRITGTVVNSEGKPVAGAQLMLASGNDAGILNLGGLTGTNADGSFTISNVPQGEHTISVRPSRPDAGGEFAVVPVSVAADTLNIRIVTGKGARVSGRVTWDGKSSRAIPAASGIAAIANLNTPRVTLQPSSPAPLLVGATTPDADGTITDAGTFTTAGSAGMVFVRVVPMPPGWLLKSVTLDGEDITDVPLDLSSHGSIDDVRIVLTDRGSDLSGHVTDSRGNALKDYVVVLLPAAPPAGASMQRFIRVVRPDQDGQFRVKTLVPGRYIATALEWIEQGRQFVPEFQDELRRQGKAITLREGEATTLELKLTGL